MNSLERRLSQLRAPGEATAAERSRGVVMAGFGARGQLPARTRVPRRVVVVALAAALAATAALTPAGAAVVHLVREALTPQPGLPHARNGALDLPAGGRVLVNSAHGPWIVQRDGSRRLLGAYRDATWSPHGLFVAATRGRMLAAIDPKGAVRWTVSRPGAAADPRWSPDGYRIAYRSGRTLRVVAGDGTGDRLLARAVAPVAPQWRPGALHQLAYTDAAGRVRTIGTDGNTRLWRLPAGRAVTGLRWTPDGRELLVLGLSSLRLHSAGGVERRELSLSARARVADAAFSPDGRLAVLEYNTAIGRSRLLLLAPMPRTFRTTTLFQGAGHFSSLDWSPDGRWLLLAWSDADQWLFIRSSAVRRVDAASSIGRAFDPGGRGRAGFPSVAGWCCSPRP